MGRSAICVTKNRYKQIIAIRLVTRNTNRITDRIARVVMSLSRSFAWSSQRSLRRLQVRSSYDGLDRMTAKPITRRDSTTSGQPRRKHNILSSTPAVGKPIVICTSTLHVGLLGHILLYSSRARSTCSNCFHFRSRNGYFLNILNGA